MHPNRQLFRIYSKLSCLGVKAISTDTDTQEVSSVQDQSRFTEALLQSYVSRIVDHDQAALELLYESLLGQVYGLALRITQRAGMAEEIVQDTFWQVWRQAPRFNPERGSVRAWILTMARSRALDALRSLETETDPLDEEILDTQAAPEQKLPADQLALIEQNQQLQGLLMQLDSVPRQLVSLAFYRGYSHEEIAQLTGLPLGSVKSHIRRALLTLKQFLVPDADEGSNQHE